MVRLSTSYHDTTRGGKISLSAFWTVPHRQNVVDAPTFTRFSSVRRDVLATGTSTKTALSLLGVVRIELSSLLLKSSSLSERARRDRLLSEGAEVMTTSWTSKSLSSESRRPTKDLRGADLLGRCEPFMLA